MLPLGLSLSHRGFTRAGVMSIINVFISILFCFQMRNVHSDVSITVLCGVCLQEVFFPQQGGPQDTVCGTGAHLQT